MAQQQAAGRTLTEGQQAKVAASVAQLRQALADHGTVTYSCSLGAESIVLTDLIWTQAPAIDIFTIDTGRLHEQTYSLLEMLERRYQRRMRLVHPQAAAVEAWVAAHGINGFYGSVAARRACCDLRKVEPFARAVKGFGAWVTGVRREQSAERAQIPPVEFDAANGLYKVSPLLDWTHDDVWTYIRAKGLPYNVLHDEGFPSIGCSPCTRAVQPGEDNRAGRWWWENTDSRECGLQSRNRPAAPTPA